MGERPENGKGMRRHHTPVEHYFIPISLILLNICLIHFLFALASGQVYTAGYKLLVGAALLALVLGIFSKKKWGMLLASLFYLLILSGVPVW